MLFNDFIASDMLIVENYFGYLCGLFNFLSYKWRSSVCLYDYIFK